MNLNRTNELNELNESKTAAADAVAAATSSYLANWADAPEFIPNRLHQQSSEIVENELNDNDGDDNDHKTECVNPLEPITYAQIVSGQPTLDETDEQCVTTNVLCPFLNRVETDDGLLCPYGISCNYLHGDLCDICNQYCLHPYDQDQRRAHQTVKILFHFFAMFSN